MSHKKKGRQDAQQSSVGETESREDNPSESNQLNKQRNKKAPDDLSTVNPSPPTHCVGAARWCVTASAHSPGVRSVTRSLTPGREFSHPRSIRGDKPRLSSGAAVFCSPSISRTWHQTCLPPAQSAAPAPSLHTRGTLKTFMNFCCLWKGEKKCFFYVLKREILIQHPRRCRTVLTEPFHHCSLDVWLVSLWHLL